MKKRLTLDERYAVIAARLNSIIPTPVRRSYARLIRRLPRPELLILLFAACAAVAAERTPVIAHVVVIAQMRAVGLMHQGLPIEALHYEIVTLSSLLLEAASLLFATLAGTGIALVMAPTRSKRRLLRRMIVWSTVCSLAAISLIPCSNIVERFASAPHVLHVPVFVAQSRPTSAE